MKRTICCFLFSLIMIFTNHTESKENLDKVDKVVELLRTACVAKGEKIEIEATGNAGITLRHLKNAKIEGKVSFKKEEVTGFIYELNQISAQQASEVRECFKPYIEQMVNMIVSETISSSSEKYEKKAITYLMNGYIPKYCIRFIDAKHVSEEGLHNGTVMLGQEDKHVIFVADYDELKGIEINHALDKIGGIDVDKNVIAVIFTTSRNSKLQIAPGSVRGIYKFLRNLNEDKKLRRSYPLPKDPELIVDINNNNGIRRHGLKMWIKHLWKYTQAFKEIEDTDNFQSDFSEINKREWDPRGFSHNYRGYHSPIDFEELNIYNYGALVFLVRNVPINSLKNAITIKLDLDKRDKESKVPILTPEQIRRGSTVSITLY